LDGVLRDLIVTATLPLQEAEAVTEGIAQARLATPYETLNRSRESSAGGNGSFGGCVDVENDEVEMDRRPMSPIVARQRRVWSGETACLLLQQKDSHRSSRELGDCAFEEPTTELEVGCTLIELDCRLEVWNVDVDHGFHGLIAPSSARRHGYRATGAHAWSTELPANVDAPASFNEAFASLSASLCMIRHR
jgi:hypothetical protein